MSGLLFSNDFVRLAQTGSALHCLIDIVHNYSKSWRFKANIKKMPLLFFFFQKRKGFEQVGLKL